MCPLLKGHLLIFETDKIPTKFKFYHNLVQKGNKIKAVLGMLDGGENTCGWLFMLELLPLGYHCMRTWQSLNQSEAEHCSWNTDCWTNCNSSGTLSFAEALTKQWQKVKKWRARKNAGKRKGKPLVLPFSLALLARPADGFPVFWPVSQDSAKESGSGMLIFFCSRRAWKATIRYLLPP